MPCSAPSCSGTCCASAATSTTRRRPRRCRTCSASTPNWCSTPGPSSGRSITCWCASSRRQGVGDRPEEAPVRGGRSARRARTGDRRLQGRQRTRRGDARRPSLLLRRLHPRPDAGPDHRRHHARRGGVPGKGHRTASRGRGQALRHRQLPGRLGGDDAGRDPAGTVRADHHPRLAAVLLGRGGRREPDALHRRAAGRQLADRADQRPRRRQVRRRLSGRRTSRISIRPTRSGPRTTISGRRSTPRGRASSNSRNGGAATSTSTPRKCSGSSINCSSATGWPPPKSSPATACASTCATSARRSSASAPRATTSPRRNRRWAGSSISTRRTTTSAPAARPSSTRSTTASAISASSSPAASPGRSTRSSPPTST